MQRDPLPMIMGLFCVACALVMGLVLLCGCDGTRSPESLTRARTLVPILLAEAAAQANLPTLPDQLADPTSAGDPIADMNPAELDHRIVVLTATWCGPCRKLKTQLEALHQAGWSVGPEASNQIQVLEAQSDPAVEFLLRHRRDAAALPKFFVIEQGHVIKESIGYRDAFGVGALW